MYLPKFLCSHSGYSCLIVLIPHESLCRQMSLGSYSHLLHSAGDALRFKVDLIPIVFIPS